MLTKKAGLTGIMKAKAECSIESALIRAFSSVGLQNSALQHATKLHNLLTTHGRSINFELNC